MRVNFDMVFRTKIRKGELVDKLCDRNFWYFIRSNYRNLKQGGNKSMHTL